MYRNIIILILFVVSVGRVHSQIQPDHLNLELTGGYAGKNRVPFWLESNRFGNIPLKGLSTGIIAGISKDLNGSNVFDWSYSVKGRINAGEKVNFSLIEGYIRIQKGIFEIRAGRSTAITGICDTLLSSGSFAISGNAPGIPMVELSIPDFYTLPFLGHVISFKGNYIHGWMGNWHINGKRIPDTQTYFHQKSLYGRFGKENWRLKLYGGFNHEVTWGCEEKVLGDSYPLNGLQSFMYVNIGKEFTHDSINITRVGNHLGSVDLAFSYEFRQFNILVYRQAFYDASALYYMANLRDGLNGISITHTNIKNRKVVWRKLLFEFLYTKNQGGESWSKWSTTPYEDYYNNAYYKAGWSYKEHTLGTPFITPVNKMKKGLPYSQSYYFGNNRVMMFHAGLLISIYNCEITGKASYSRNYGTYLTAPSGRIYNGNNDEALNGIFPQVQELSAMLEIRRLIAGKFEISMISAFDAGGLYDDSFGLIFGISRNF